MRSRYGESTFNQETDKDQDKNSASTQVQNDKQLMLKQGTELGTRLI